MWWSRSPSEPRRGLVGRQRAAGWLFSGFDEAGPGGVAGQLGSVAHAQLLQDVRVVMFSVLRLIVSVSAMDCDGYPFSDELEHIVLAGLEQVLGGFAVVEPIQVATHEGADHSR